ncbi:Uncharacterised protein [Mycobacteroides abscessus subsp. abscessus]|nr:Uncharacterised protein [Mycobacteroides abscessus subsp. abscessus]
MTAIDTDATNAVDPTASMVRGSAGELGTFSHRDEPLDRCRPAGANAGRSNSSSKASNVGSQPKSCPAHSSGRGTSPK